MPRLKKILPLKVFPLKIINILGIFQKILSRLEILFKDHITNIRQFCEKF